MGLLRLILKVQQMALLKRRSVMYHITVDGNVRRRVINIITIRIWLFVTEIIIIIVLSGNKGHHS